MPSGNFDDNLPIDEHKCLSPAGPLTLGVGETPVRLDIWVFQQEGSCVAIQQSFPNPARWTTTPDPHDDHSGAGFVPGLAVGMGLLVTRTSAGQTKVTQWTEGITLVAGGKNGDDHHT